MSAPFARATAPWPPPCKEHGWGLPFRASSGSDRVLRHDPHQPSGVAENSEDRASSLRPLPDHIVNNPVFLALFGGHDVIPLRILPDPIDRLPGVQYQDVVDPVAHPQDFPRRDVDVGGMTSQPGYQRLLDHDARVRQREPLALRA